VYKRVSFVTLILFLIFTASATLAKDGKSAKAAYFNYGFKEFGIFSGYHWGKLKEQGHYEVIPAMLHLGFDMRPLFKNKSNILLEFMLEPFINTVIGPNNNAEIGNNFLFKFGFPLSERLYPYIAGGCGLVYLTLHTREQSTQFNFTDQGEVGITYFLKKNLFASIGYRYRHISNASIKSPNSGINSNSVICGVSFLY
jgi:hypothetical protein